MIRLFLFRFWPVLIPLIAYALWLRTVRRKAEKERKPALRFREGPWYWAVLLSLLIGMGCFVLLLPDRNDKGPYTPPHMENGRLVPGQVGGQP